MFKVLFSFLLALLTAFALLALNTYWQLQGADMPVRVLNLSFVDYVQAFSTVLAARFSSVPGVFQVAFLIGMPTAISYMCRKNWLVSVLLWLPLLLIIVLSVRGYFLPATRDISAHMIMLWFLCFVYIFVLLVFGMFLLLKRTRQKKRLLHARRMQNTADNVISDNGD